MIIDGPNCIIGSLPDNTLFMAQDRKKLRPGIIGQIAGWAHEDTAHVHQLAEGKIGAQHAHQEQVNVEQWADAALHLRAETH